MITIFKQANTVYILTQGKFKVEKLNDTARLSFDCSDEEFERLRNEFSRRKGRKGLRKS